MSFNFPQCLFWIGSPLECKPNHDLSGFQKFLREQPDWATVFVTSSEEERQKLAEAMKNLKWPNGHPGSLIVVWNDDTEMMDAICGDLHFVNTWKVVGSAWYECEAGHILPSTLKAPLEKCSTCEKPVKFVRLNEERVTKFNELMKTAINLMNFDTTSGVALHQVVNPTGNVMKNMPYAIGLPEAPALNLEDFHLKGKGKAAFCVSAGPSLKRDIQHLKRLQDEALILCVGRVYKMLRAEGIRVDYTFSCEMFDWDSAIFQGLTKEGVGDTILCYPPVCAPLTVKTWPGKRLCVWDASSGELCDRKMVMMGGNSVSHHMYNFAGEILGCEPIIFIGQDLGYTESATVTHADGSDHPWPEEVQARDKILQDEDWGPCNSDTAGPFHADTHKIAGAISHGIVPVGPVLVRTSPSYKCFASLFEILIKRHKKKTWNACSNGLKIQGAPYLNLSTLTSLKDCG